jgi:serine/threonine protein kinase
MHNRHIVHRDIKPDNCLYSPSQKSYVFSDFGLSNSLLQNFRQQTYTYYAGTPGYMIADL